jgi:hypothetical protein
VAVTSLRLISFSFQEQATLPESNQAIQQAQRDGDENAPGFIMQMHEVREPAETRLVADAERRWRETEQRQADLGQGQAELRHKQDEERKLAEARRQAEQQQRERREAQQREADLGRRLEEHRKLAQVWLQEEQERQRREAQLEADLRRMREDERKLGLQPEKQRPQRDAEPVRKSEGTVAAGQLQPDGKPLPERKTNASPAAWTSPAEPTSQASSSGQQQPASVTRASGTRQKNTTICMLFGSPAADVGRAGGPSMRGKSAGGPSLRGTSIGKASTEVTGRARTRVRQATWQVQAMMQAH